MDKKIILITGATRGIGKETALGLANQGHHIVLHGRNETHLNEVCDEIKTITGNYDIDIIRIKCCFFCILFCIFAGNKKTGKKQ